ncbi:MAG: septal ring lytic transglycosylase RlpA family protein [Thiobacillaceae bacterium]
MNSKWTKGIGVWVVVLMAGCSSAPSITQKKSPVVASIPAKSGGYYLDDGPDAHPPTNLSDVPDAVPRREPLHRFANRSYVALGNTYTPDTEIRSYQEEGVASWYGKRFHGNKTASGELYDMYGMTAAHRTLPIPSYARVTSMSNGKSVVVRINDRGPFSRDRLIDLSYTAAHKLGYLGAGSTRVRVESIDPSQYDVGGVPLQPGIYLQLGAFNAANNAHKLLQKVQAHIESSSPSAHVVLAGTLHRVTLGPYPSDADAESGIMQIKERLGMASVKLVR